MGIKRKASAIVMAFTIAVLSLACSNAPSGVDENSGGRGSSGGLSEKPETQSRQGIEIGKPAVGFKVKTLDGKDADLSDYRGKYVLINFWATWCKYCIVEMPDIQRFSKGNSDFAVLAMSSGESRETVQKFINDNGYRLNVLLDEDGSVARAYGVTGFPTSVYIDKSGNVQGVKVGMMDLDTMNEYAEYMRSEFK